MRIVVSPLRKREKDHAFPSSSTIPLPPRESHLFRAGENARASGWMRPHLNARTYIGEMFNFMGHFVELYVGRTGIVQESTKNFQCCRRGISITMSHHSFILRIRRNGIRRN